MQQAAKENKIDPYFATELRKKFIETAKNYIGVPYAQKYTLPTEPMYYAPLFLDCCGLVRRSVYDLRNYFGYCLKTFN